MADFRLQIVTQQYIVFDESVTSLTMPGKEGSFGVLAHHQAIIAVLKEGKAIMRQGNKETPFKILGGGFFQMEDNKAALLIDGVEGLKIKLPDED